MKITAETGKRALWTAFAVLWLSAAVAGLGYVASYDNSPGVPAKAPARWPAASHIEPAGNGPTLVMMAHPQCDCTRASLVELAELMARATKKPRAYVVFVEPAGVGRDWMHTDLWKSAERIPGVTVLRDRGGVEADLFGVETSGQTLLYGADGRLLFTGGTTGARGHTGDNEGRASMLALLNGTTPRRSLASVFGCGLFTRGRT